MSFRTIFRPRRKAVPSGAPALAADEAFFHRLERLAIVANRTLRGGLTGEHRSQRHLPAPTIADHRPYSSGDDLRYVDWHAYARHDALHIKMGEAEQDIAVNLLLDGSTSMDWASQTGKWLAARQLAAAIGYCTLAAGDRLTVKPFGSGIAAPFVAHGRLRAPSLLTYLDHLESGGPGDIAQTLRSTVREQRGGLIVVISDLWHAAGLEDCLKLYHPPRWQVVVLHLLHPSELDPVVDGAVQLEDSETGATIDLLVDEGLRERYRARVHNWQQEMASMCTRQSVRYALITSEQPLEQAIMPYLVARQVLR